MADKNIPETVLPWVRAWRKLYENRVTGCYNISFGGGIELVATQFPLADGTIMEWSPGAQEYRPQGTKDATDTTS